MSEMFKNHLQRLKAGSSQAHSLAETSRWISDNTFIRGKPYSYKGREYQKKILDCDAQEMNSQKCSQMGVSEVAVRKALASCGIINNFTCIYTLPTSTFAATLSKTRVDPVIRESPFLSEMMTATDNVEVKQIGSSFLYLKGSSSGNAPISIPADFLIHDEIDFSDEQIITQYQSRLTASPYKMKWRFSTPTIPGKGINKHFMASKRHHLMAKCSCCCHYFLPDYYEHVKIPGFTGDLLEITKSNLHKYNYRSAFVMCPKCGGKPDLSIENREWVVENPDDNMLAHGVQVSPFDSPSIITPGYLIESSTQYSNIADFVNFGLGLPYFSQESVLSPDEIQGCIVPNRFEGGSNVIGIDLGKTCHVLIASTCWDGAMQVIHMEKVPLQLLKERYKELRVQYRVRMSVIDSLPYTDTVLALQAMDTNLYASVYVQTKGVELFTVKQRDENAEKGVQTLRQLNVSRDRTFDAIMAFIRTGMFSKVSCPLDSEFVTHCTDMRRVKDWNMRSQQIEFKWVKSVEGDDHFWFALSYAYLASKILGTSQGSMMQLPLISTFKLQPVLQS